MLVWLPDTPERRLLDPPPEGVRVAVVPDDLLNAPDLDAVEFLVANSRSVIPALPRMRSLRVVQTLSAGVDWIEAEVPAGVTLCGARGAHDIPTAEWVLTAILAMVKRIPHAVRNQDEERWERWRQSELSGQTALIVGHGSIGRAVEERLTPFGVRVEGVVSRARDGLHGVEDLRRLLPQADIVVLLVPLTSATRGLVDAEFLAAMRDGALLVNAARGPVVDSGALLAELRSGRLRAAVDVTDPEPLPPGDALWHAPNLLITPHHAGNSAAAKRRAFLLVREQLERYRDGRELLAVARRG